MKTHKVIDNMLALISQAAADSPTAELPHTVFEQDPLTLQQVLASLAEDLTAIRDDIDTKRLYERVRERGRRLRDLQEKQIASNRRARHLERAVDSCRRVIVALGQQLPVERARFKTTAPANALEEGRTY